jgi:thiamine-monophosphate kinase
VPAPTVGDIGEREVIRRIRRRLPAPPDWLVTPIGDDAAVLRPARNRDEVLTTDVLVEGVHFDRAYVPPAAIGAKALAVNLSDLAAMGAEPRLALLSLILPADTTVSDLDSLVGGMLDLAARYGVTLAGGNVARSPGPLVVDATALGCVKPRDVLLRRGAKAGHDIYVSGSIGAARAGRLALVAGRTGGGSEPGGDGLDDARARFLVPEPRMRLGLLLARNRVASACMDLSDGLADALRGVADAGRVGAILDAEALPVPAVVRRAFEEAGLDPLVAALEGGEDYELLFTVPRRRRRALAGVLARVPGVPCTRIGTVTRERRIVLRREGAEGALPAGFTHFTG